MASSRRLRAFKRWMRSQGIQYSDALDFKDDPVMGVSVIALSNLKEGDLVATIPKSSCLTVRTSGASELIEAAGLGGSLGLSVAIMYEKSLGEDSPWAGYLQLLPEQETVPFVWSIEEVDSLLCGTELHKVVKEDKAFMFEDWKESILSFLDSAPLKLNPEFFGVGQYFAARSLVSSRSFEIDDYHGFGMVPLADLFNHKTVAEDVHFTHVSSHSESDNDAYNDNYEQANSVNNGTSSENSCQDIEESSASPDGKNSLGDNYLEGSVLRDRPTVLQMIIVKDVRVGAEVFNTYGLLGNAAMLYRYGFTEPDNSYDIVNIDLELVVQWGLSLFSSRHGRARLSLWRRLGHCGCGSQNSEYFEITTDGVPQIELLILLYIMLLSEDTYDKLDFALSAAGSYNEAICTTLSEKNNLLLGKASEMRWDQLLTESVCNALCSLADLRESLYPSDFKEDIEHLRSCIIQDGKLYHSLSLRVSERRLLEKLRIYAATHMQSIRTVKRSSARKRLKRNELQHFFI